MIKLLKRIFRADDTVDDADYRRSLVVMMLLLVALFALMFFWRFAGE